MRIVQREHRVHEEPREQDRPCCKPHMHAGGVGRQPLDIVQLEEYREQYCGHGSGAETQHRVASFILKPGPPLHYGKRGPRHHDPHGHQKGQRARIEGNEKPRGDPGPAGQKDIDADCKPRGDQEPRVAVEMPSAQQGAPPFGHRF